MLQVPTNRFGHGYFSAAELKTIQEVITLSVFAVFSMFYLNEPPTWNHFAGFGLITLWLRFSSFTNGPDASLHRGLCAYAVDSPAAQA